MVMFLLIKKETEIAIISNASNSSSDLYFRHFVGAEAISQSCMLIFSSQNKILGLLQLL